MAFLSYITKAISAYWLPLCVVSILARLVYNRYGKGLSAIPGPFLASLSDGWLFLHYLHRKGSEEYDLHQKFKSALVRFGPNTVSVSDAEAVRIIYGWKPVFSKVSTSARQLCPRCNRQGLSDHVQSRLYISQDVTTEDGTVLENVSSTRSEGIHRDLRRLVAHTYSLSTLVEYEPLVDSTSQVFMKQMDRFSETREVCPFGSWLQMYAFDVM